MCCQLVFAKVKEADAFLLIRLVRLPFRLISIYSSLASVLARSRALVCGWLRFWLSSAKNNTALRATAQALLTALTLLKLVAITTTLTATTVAAAAMARYDGSETRKPYGG